jgi:MFS family permease
MQDGEVVVTGEGPAASSRNPYLALLRTPGALAFSSTGFVGRMSMSMYGLGTVLLIASLTGHYGEAGLVAGAGSIGFALFSPFIARLSDQFGQGRVILTEVSIFIVAVTGFLAAAELRAPFVVLLLTGTAAGATMPSMSSLVRTRWSMLLSDSSQLHAAFALESVNDEVIFVIGPAVVTLLATQWFPAAGVGTAGVLIIVGSVLFALQRRTEPPVQPRPPRADTGQRWKLSRPSVPAVALITLSPAFLALGMMFASIDLSTVAFASEHGHRPLAGLILGTYSLGSGIGGFWYGSRHWRAPLGRRFITTTAITVAGVSTFWALPGLLALTGVCVFAGMAVAPTLIAGYGILERQAEPGRSTEAMAWLASTISVGVAIGSAIAGHIIDAHGARASYVFAACCGAVAVLICLAGRRKLEITEPAAQPPVTSAELGVA